ncbi:MAG: DUF5688 family protein [Lachnospiraceae bacterium]|nr:DUF5688 family protein [Lachnospiraceae bacterium]
MCKQTKERFVMDLTKSLSERTKGIQITVKEINKTNDTKRTALNLTNEGENIGKVFYIENYFNDYKNGQAIEDIVNNIIDTFNSDNSGVHDKCKALVDKLKDYERIKDVSGKLNSIETGN